MVNQIISFQGVEDILSIINQAQSTKTNRVRGKNSHGRKFLVIDKETNILGLTTDKKLKSSLKDIITFVEKKIPVVTGTESKDTKTALLISSLTNSTQSYVKKHSKWYHVAINTIFNRKICRNVAAIKSLTKVGNVLSKELHVGAKINIEKLHTQLKYDPTFINKKIFKFPEQYQSQISQIPNAPSNEEIMDIVGKEIKKGDLFKDDNLDKVLHFLPNGTIRKAFAKTYILNDILKNRAEIPQLTMNLMGLNSKMNLQNMSEDFKNNPDFRRRVLKSQSFEKVKQFIGSMENIYQEIANKYNLPVEYFKEAYFKYDLLFVILVSANSEKLLRDIIGINQSITKLKDTAFTSEEQKVYELAECLIENLMRNVLLIANEAWNQA